MQNIEPLQSFEQIKLLADSRRMTILRLLMASPATLTHLARTLKRTPAWIRHHIKVLESANLIELAKVRTTGTVTEKFYCASAGAFLLQQLVLPKDKKPVIVFSGSHDLALEVAIVSLSKHINLIGLPVGSLDGLMNLRQGLCQISGAHLLDETGEYNAPYVRRFFPDREVHIFTLAYRTQGLMLAATNPKGIKGIENFADLNVRIVNRNAGSGTRLWLDAELRKLGIPIQQIRGYDQMVKTHSGAASLIESHQADATLGLQAAAHQHGLDFIPLFEERYDLIVLREQEETLTPLLDYLQTIEFRRAVASLTGYSTSHSGERIL